MGIEIKNPMEDQYGNSKDNIFIAFKDDGNYLGSSYVYPNTNHRQIEEIPYLIFMDINLAENMDKSLEAEVKQLLFDKVFLRAKELREERPDLNARIYSGFQYNMENMNFYIKNGFEEDYSIIMEASIDDGFKYTLPKEVEIVDVNLEVEEELVDYKKMYDEIFISPVDMDGFIEQSKRACFKSLYFLVQGKRCGGCTIFQDDTFGYIETIYVLPEARGKGIAKVILNYIFNYFLVNGLSQTKLEVWELNKPAVSLYKSFGFNEIEKNLMFPGRNI
ncbi:GNAT family N-acetyltransferase [Clostridium sp. YIM B02505]|uniref:GNAT family N-acetyltransferase n=1 Tax=Clostridium yunnanense TaxID=2800325 RepID=A0ABS1ESB2_9CLOT|nr:GNAT family N-acetyltransferase [Clostridium yunnanense]MBK1812269.1 GNAT family N-acetyltransferase [Clostridium yunnanense]